MCVLCKQSVLCKQRVMECKQSVQPKQIDVKVNTVCFVNRGVV